MIIGNYHGGYRPQYGGYPQYGQQYGQQYGGYPGGGHHQHHHHGYGYPAYPGVGQSYGSSRPQRPHGVIVSREQLATLLAADPSLAEFVYPLSLNAAAAAGPMPGYHFGQPSIYNRQQPKPQQFYQSANPLAAYYQQFLQSQQYQPITSEKFGPAGRFQPPVSAIRQQQPRPFGYYPKPSAASALDRYRF